MDKSGYLKGSRTKQPSDNMDKCKEDISMATHHKHDTIVNLYKEIAIYDQTSDSQINQVDDFFDMEMNELETKDLLKKQSFFRRSSFIISVLLLAVVVFVLCPFIQLTQKPHDKISSDDTDGWGTEHREKFDGNFVKMENLWDG